MQIGQPYLRNLYGGKKVPAFIIIQWHWGQFLLIFGTGTDKVIGEKSIPKTMKHK